MTHHDDADDASISVARSPTRRRLLFLLSRLLAAAIIPGSPPARSIVDTGVCAPDTIPDLFDAFDELPARHEAAIWRCDRPKAFLLAELDHPRVRLPMQAGCPIRYAAEIETIIRFVPPGSSRWRLQEVLLRRQHAWTRGARACGLNRAQAQEATLDAAVREAAATLLARRTTTLGDISTKILVLLTSQEPDGAFRDVSPWGELRSILSDIARLLQGADASSPPWRPNALGVPREAFRRRSEGAVIDTTLQHNPCEMTSPVMQ